MSKKNIWIAAVVIVIAALGFMGYRQIAAKRASAEAPAPSRKIVLLIALDPDLSHRV